MRNRFPYDARTAAAPLRRRHGHAPARARRARPMPAWRRSTLTTRRCCCRCTATTSTPAPTSSRRTRSAPTALKLAHFGLADRLLEINRRAVEIARQAQAQTSRPVFVAGAIGPLDVGLPGGESVTLKKAHRVFREQAEALHRGRRRPHRHRDVPDAGRGEGGAAGRARVRRPAGDGPAIVPARRPHLGRRRARRGGAGPARPGRERRRRQLRARAAVRARHHQADWRWRSPRSFRRNRTPASRRSGSRR